MAISFVDNGSGANISGGDVTVAIGTTPTTDDLLIIAYAIGDDDTVDQTMAMVTAGYTLVPGPRHHGATVWRISPRMATASGTAIWSTSFHRSKRRLYRPNSMG